MGSGKSRVLRSLETHGYACVQEPIDEWADWLDAFYSDPAHMMFPFQTKVLCDYSRMDVSTKSKGPWVFERSPLDSKEVFSSFQRMDPLCQKLYHELYDLLAWEPDAIIYLRTDPDIAYERVKRRDRESERNVAYEYVRHIHDRYESFLREQGANRLVFTVNANDTIDLVIKHVLSIIEHLKDTV